MHFNALDQPTASPTIIQTPVEPIIEGNKVTQIISFLIHGL
jgi:hypothetical protein